MTDKNFALGNLIRPEMTLLEVVELYPPTEAVFRKYDPQAGVCLCCQALFEPLQGMAEKYNLDLQQILRDLEAAIDSDLKK